MPEALYKKPKKWEKKFKQEIDYWKKVPWEKKVTDSGYVNFEAERAKAQRAEIAEQIAKERAASQQKLIGKLKAELEKPWGQRERNKGLANKLWWRPFFLVQDILALPFFAGSWLLSRLARPISWINDRLLRRPQYLSKTGRTQLPKGTTFRKDFFPSMGAERRELAEQEKAKRKTA